MQKYQSLLVLWAEKFIDEPLAEAFGYLNAAGRTLRGQLVSVLLDAWRLAGTHIIKWNASNNASGIYICNFEADLVPGISSFLADDRISISLIILK